ncbi:MAG: PhoH family protein [Pseudomonadota bacterium]
MTFDDNTLLPLFFGEHNAHLRHLEETLSLSATHHGNQVTLQGNQDAVSMGEDILGYLWRKTKEGRDMSTAEIDAAHRFLLDRENIDKKDNTTEPKSKTKKKSKKMATQKMPYDENAGIKTYKNKMILPRSPNQARYVEAIKDNDMVFGIGPAGTGKTFLAVAAAVHMYQEGLVERLIFCRPAVEAGEQLGFLPGDMLEKIDPYLRPIYDALHEMMPGDKIPKKIESGDIEIAPLAFMRGRTLKNAFVVLDEAQNTTSMQMKMFLTRMGQGTRMVITGDPSQVDLPPNTKSGLKEAMSILDSVEEVPFVHFESSDVVRHKLVTKIIKAYDKYESGKY